ncbi:MAG: polysaccharide biosynthesis protein [Asticcacaulis sp.]
MSLRSVVADSALSELLSRNPVDFNESELSDLIRGRRVMVTGAGGSIGSEICRLSASLNAAHISLLESSELALFNIHTELFRDYPDASVSDVLADIRDVSRIDQVFEREQPDIVFHAAALKHVYLVEHNPTEGVLTNVIGTRNIIRACQAHGVAQMVQISTDKAVNPNNVMGATKYMAESLVCAESEVAGTQFCAVRFGNVLGSTGSVVEVFRKQISAGGPVTLTHPEAERYFMTIHEAVQLVMLAALTSAKRGPAPARLFVLELGEPVKIRHLAEKMIRMAGLVPGQDMAIEVTGLRDGERLQEALIATDELRVPFTQGVMELRKRNPTRGITRFDIDMLEAIARQGDADHLRTVLFDMIERHLAANAVKDSAMV